MQTAVNFSLRPRAQLLVTRDGGEQRTHLDERRLPAAVAPDDADAAVEIDAEVDLRKQWAGMMICDDDAD